MHTPTPQKKKERKYESIKITHHMELKTERQQYETKHHPFIKQNWSYVGNGVALGEVVSKYFSFSSIPAVLYIHNHANTFTVIV
jgi:hypothetical protein